MNPANDNAVGEPLRFLSVCSGIEAASVAWHQLGWKAVAFAEIEKFPSAVLAHHYPDVPNLGDFTKIDTSTLGRVDILCGGTPCQAFSVAGLRGGLNDARGNLTLAFVELAHELAAGNGLRNIIWENVVGVLSDKTNAFGSFLGGLVGADSAIEPPTRGKWGNAGLVSGPKGRAAWRVVDAQFFGVAQRRRRVLVVADFGNGADPAQVLFELEGVQRHTAPSREARKDIAPTISARTKGGGGLGTDFDLDGGLIEAVRIAPTVSTGTRGVGDFELGGGLALGYAPEIARCVATREGSSQDYETTTMVAVEVAPTMRAGGNSTGGDRPYGTDVDTCDSLAIVHAIQAGALRTNPNSGPDGVGVQEGIAYTLEARSEVQAVCIHADAIGRTGDAMTPSADAAGVVRLRNPGMGIVDDGTTYNLMASGQPHAVAYSIMPQNSGKDYKARVVDVAQPLMAGGPVGGNQGGDFILEAVCVTGDIAHTLKAEGADASEDGAGRGTPIIAFSSKDYGGDASFDLSPTLRAGGHSGSHANAGVMPAIAQTVAIRGREGGATAELGGEVATALRASQGGGDKPHVLTSAVRRLTPRECERLQGFQWLCSPDYPGAWQDDAGRWWSPDYTLIPQGNKLKGEAKEELAAYFERTGQFMKEVADGEWVFDRVAFEAAWPRLSADGPRYKALGNSWAVPKFVWLGRRIARLMPTRAAQKEAA